MADPTDIGQVAANPWPTTASPPDELTAQALFVSIGKRIGPMPTDYSIYPGQPMVVAQDGSGPTALSVSGNSVMDLGGVGVVGNPLTAVTITGSGLVTWNAHLGRDLLYAGAGGITLTLNLDATGQLGVKNTFQCLIVRAYDGGSVGTVTIALGAGLTSQRSDGKTAVAAGGRVGVQVIGSRVFLTGSLV